MNDFDEKQIARLKRLMTLMEPDGLTKEEFIKSFQEVMKLVVKVESDLVAKINTLVNDKVSSGVSSLQAMKEEMQKAIADAKKSNDSTFTGMKQRAMTAMQEMFSRLDVQGKMAEMYSEHEAMMQKMESVLPDTEKMMKDMLAEVPKDTAEEERDRLESLKGEERLDKSAIKGLEDEIKSLRKEIATKTSGVRRVFQPYVDNFSAMTNGSLKTFVLSREPLRTNTVQVFGTDFPTILNPDVDFTVSGKTLTLTSAVPAPNTGATLLIHYFA